MIYRYLYVVCMSVCIGGVKDSMNELNIEGSMCLWGLM